MTRRRWPARPRRQRIPMPISAAANFGFNNGMAFDGTNLWLLAGGIGNDQIYKLNPDTGAVIDIHHLGGTTEWDGLGWLNGLLYAQDSPSAQGGRGLTRGLIFKQDGTLIASVAQEGSVRERRAEPDKPKS